MLDSVLKDFGINAEEVSVTPLRQGLINSTWIVSGGTGMYVVQQMNSNVFRHPEDIAFNISAVEKYLGLYYPDYPFVSPVPTVKGEYLLRTSGNAYYRVFPFVKGSHAKTVVSCPEEAYEAARQFGMFTKLLAGFDASSLKTTIPAFHNLTLRYNQFMAALKEGNAARQQRAGDLIATLQSYSHIAGTYEAITGSKDFKQRVTHHDTKISNVLFDGRNKGLCIIDLDTMMPGYFISDVGDMMRTYLSPASEEETDYSKIEIRADYYAAVLTGYLEQMRDELTETEKDYFLYAGTFMIYMQALRFLTDYLRDDVYYGARYPEHNLIRAGNQAALLKSLLEKRDVLEKALWTTR